MEVSKEKIELLEKVRQYRSDTQLMEILKFKNEVLEKQNSELKENLKNLHMDVIDKNNLLEEIKKLKKDKIALKQSIGALNDRFEFVVTTPKSTNSVYGEIKNNLKKAEHEILICSPWITYLVDEFSVLGNGISSKFITNLREEDIERQITDVDKFRVLEEHGAEIKYNNDLHAKIVIIDNRVAIISSANMTKRGLLSNYEAGVLIKDQKQVQKAVEFFNGIWEESEPLTKETLENIIKLR